MTNIKKKEEKQSSLLNPRVNKRSSFLGKRHCSIKTNKDKDIDGHKAANEHPKLGKVVARKGLVPQP